MLCRHRCWWWCVFYGFWLCMWHTFLDSRSVLLQLKLWEIHIYFQSRFEVKWLWFSLHWLAFETNRSQLMATHSCDEIRSESEQIFFFLCSFKWKFIFYSPSCHCKCVCQSHWFLLCDKTSHDTLRFEITLMLPYLMYIVLICIC